MVVVEDDDDEGDEDDGRDFPRPPPSIPTRGSCGRDQTTDGDSIAFSEETAAAVHPAGVDDDDGHVQGELATPRPEGSGQPGRFEYAVSMQYILILRSSGRCTACVCGHLRRAT